MKGSDRVIVDRDVVRMAIRAAGVKRYDDLRALLADNPDQTPDNFFRRRVDVRSGVGVLLSAGHARVAIVEKDEVVDAQVVGRATQLVLAHPPERLRRCVNALGDLTHVTVCGAHEANLRAAAGIMRQRSACAEGLIVRMRE